MVTINTKEYSMDDYKSKYDDISSLYDYADELLLTVEDSRTSNPAKHLELVEPLVNEIADSSDVLAEEFLLIAESQKNRSASKFSKKRIESALRRIFMSLSEYHRNVRLLYRKTSSIAYRITNEIVDKIQKHLDNIVVIFFEFINISLQSIMSKTELAALKERDSRIAVMLNQSLISQYN
ncbi:MAG: hypothetical protein R3D71_05230 [Rickettsiales bacterium]